MPDALPAVTVPSFEKAGLSLATASSVVPGADVLVVLDHHVALAGRDRDRHDLVLEAAGLLGRLGLVLGGHRELVLLLAGDLPFLGDVLGGRAHVVAVEGVPQAVLDHRVDELHVAHLGAGAHVGGVGRERHRFLAARHDDVRHRRWRSAACRSRPSRSPEPQTWFRPQAVFSFGIARRHRRLPGRVLPLRGGEDLAEDDLVHLGGVDLRALERRLDGDRAEFVGRGVGEGAVERADGGAGRADDDDVLGPCEISLFAAHGGAAAGSMRRSSARGREVKGGPRGNRAPDRGGKPCALQFSAADEMLMVAA